MKINWDAIWGVQDDNADARVLTCVDLIESDDSESDEGCRTDVIIIDKATETVEHIAYTDEGEEITFPWDQIKQTGTVKNCFSMICSIALTPDIGKLDEVLAKQQSSWESTVLMAAIRCLDTLSLQE